MAKRWIEIIINVIFWGVTGWLIASGFSIQSQEIEVVNDVETVRVVRNETILLKLLICIGISMLMFYANLWLSGKLKSGFKTGLIFYSLLIFTASASLYYLLEYNGFSDSIPLPASLSWGIFVFYYTISIAYGMGRVWVVLEKQRTNLVLEKKQAELNLLRNQLQPHFLFNVLNNLLSMVDQARNPVLANSLDKLSSLLRFVVYDTMQGRVTIWREIEFLQNYAELQLLRFEKDEVDFKLEVMGDNDHQEIEPGLFIPFVENAFKYGVEPEVHSKIHVVFDLSEPGVVLFTIINHVIPALKNKTKTGTGIRSTRERLKLAYPEVHWLEIKENENFMVELKINTHAGDHR